MLDAGHGGRDPGAVYNGRQEKIDTLSLTLAIGQILQERGIDVLYTRTTDIYESPYQKAMEANEAGVDFFISIHRNSFPQDNAVSGVESLVYDKSGIKLEMAENINEQLEGIGFVNLGVKARPGLVVLRRTKMPAVLVEVGFINSDTDNMLFDDNFSDIALAIAEGILDTLGINTPVVPLPDENEAPVAPLPDENTYPDDAFPNEDNVPVVPLPPRYTVQTGAFRNPLYAERLRRELSELDFPASVTYRIRLSHDICYIMSRLVKSFKSRHCEIRRSHINYFHYQASPSSVSSYISFALSL